MSFHKKHACRALCYPDWFHRHLIYISKVSYGTKKIELKIGAKIKKFTSFHFVIILEISIADWKFIPLVYDFHTVALADFR
jgi:hypothetical protein